MEQLLNIVQQNGGISGWLIIAFDTVTELELAHLVNGLSLVAVFLLGSAFWQASERMQIENKYLLPLIDSIYSWRTDSLLFTYISLLTLLIILTAIIANTAVSDYTFWAGNIAVFLGQTTASGQRFGSQLVQACERVFKSSSGQLH